MCCGRGRKRVRESQHEIEREREREREREKEHFHPSTNNEKAPENNGLVIAIVAGARCRGSEVNQVTAAAT